MKLHLLRTVVPVLYNRTSVAERQQEPSMLGREVRLAGSLLASQFGKPYQPQASHPALMYRKDTDKKFSFNAQTLDSRHYGMFSSLPTLPTLPTRVLGSRKPGEYGCRRKNLPWLLHDRHFRYTHDVLRTYVRDSIRFCKQMALGEPRTFNGVVALPRLVGYRANQVDAGGLTMPSSTDQSASSA